MQPCKQVFFCICVTIEKKTLLILLYLFPQGKMAIMIKLKHASQKTIDTFVNNSLPNDDSQERSWLGERKREKLLNLFSSNECGKAK